MKLKSFIKFLLSEFNENDDIEVSHDCDGGAFICELDDGELDDSLITITKRGPLGIHMESIYCGERIENKFGD